MKLASSKADYEKVGDEIYRLREEKQKLQLESAGRDEVKKRIADMSTFLQEQPTTRIRTIKNKKAIRQTLFIHFIFVELLPVILRNTRLK